MTLAIAGFLAVLLALLLYEVMSEWSVRHVSRQSRGAFENSARRAAQGSAVPQRTPKSRTKSAA